MSDDLIHRDDIPADIAEELVRLIQEDFPEGTRVVFAGDKPGEVPQEIKDQQKILIKVAATRFYQGQCFECGTDMPLEWPPKDDEWELPDGWSISTETYGINDIPIFICPECE